MADLAFGIISKFWGCLFEKVESLLFKIPKDQLRPSDGAIDGAHCIAKDRSNQEIIKLFELYKNPKNLVDS